MSESSSLTKTVCPAKLKIFAFLPFKENICWPLLWANVGICFLFRHHVLKRKLFSLNTRILLVRWDVHTTEHKKEQKNESLHLSCLTVTWGHMLINGRESDLPKIFILLPLPCFLPFLPVSVFSSAQNWVDLRSMDSITYSLYFKCGGLAKDRTARLRTSFADDVVLLPEAKMTS